MLAKSTTSNVSENINTYSAVSALTESTNKLDWRIRYTFARVLSYKVWSSFINTYLWIKRHKQ